MINIREIRPASRGLPQGIHVRLKSPLPGNRPGPLSFKVELLAYSTGRAPRGARIVGSHGRSYESGPAYALPEGGDTRVRCQRIEILPRVFELDTDFELPVELELADGTWVHVCTIVGKLSVPRELRRTRGIQPLILTSFGRSGSTWLAQMLSRHPKIAGLLNFYYEPRFAYHFLELFQSLASPSALYQPLANGEFERRERLLGTGANLRAGFGDFIEEREPALHSWLGRAQVRRSFEHCFGSVEATYAEAARLQRKKSPAYFCEKFYGMRGDLLARHFPRMKEILLVRDFRDVLCSVYAFNRRRNIHGFGVRPGESVRRYVDRYYRDRASDVVDYHRKNRDRLLLVRYEDLVRAPGPELARILDGLGLRTDARVLRAMRTLPDGFAEKQHRTAPSLQGSVERHLADLTSPDERHCESALADSLRYFGYPVRPGATLEATRSDAHAPG